MTAQFGDIYRYQDKNYSMVSTSNDIPFKPQKYGLRPHSACTACWRGYWCEYEIVDDKLVLKALYINNNHDKYPPLNGVEVSPQEFEEAMCYLPGKDSYEIRSTPAHFGHRVYRDVDLPVPYTGDVLLGRGFLKEFYIHRGFQMSWAFKELIKLVFIDGELQECKDLSHLAEARRESIKKRKEACNISSNERLPPGNDEPEK